MSRRKTAVRVLVILVGVLLCFVGVLHDVVNIRSLLQAVARGQIAERMAPQLVANVALASAALFLLGLILNHLAQGLLAQLKVLLVQPCTGLVVKLSAYAPKQPAGEGNGSRVDGPQPGGSGGSDLAARGAHF